MSLVEHGCSRQCLTKIFFPNANVHKDEDDSSVTPNLSTLVSQVGCEAKGLKHLTTALASL